MTDHQRVLITGGASGIGRAMAEAFLAAGASGHVADLDAAPPIGCSLTTVDVSDADGVDSLFDDVVANMGGLDVLCANVGITGPVGPVESLNVEDWDLTMSVNVRSAFLCCRRAIPLLREAGGGSILLTSSTAGITGLPMRSPYSASKHALIGLSDTLAMELGEFGIRVNTLCPGAVDGDRVRRVINLESEITGVPVADLYDAVEKHFSMRSFVEGRDIAATAVFLTSPAARYVNGQTISVDGGLETLRSTWRT